MQELSNYRKLKKKIKALELELRKKPGTVADVVKDYRTGYPVPMKIEGIEAGGTLSKVQKAYQEAIKQRETIETYLSSLPPDLYAVANLYYVQGKTQEETAEILNYSRRQIQRILNRIGQ